MLILVYYYPNNIEFDSLIYFQALSGSGKILLLQEYLGEVQVNFLYASVVIP